MSNNLLQKIGISVISATSLLAFPSNVLALQYLSSSGTWVSPSEFCSSNTPEYYSFSGTYQEQFSGVDPFYAKLTCNYTKSSKNIKAWFLPKNTSITFPFYASETRK